MKHNPIVYFIQNTDTKNVKIGSTCDLNKRLSQLQIGNESKLELIGKLDYKYFYDPYDCDGKSEEASKHHCFRHLHIRGEWYKYKDELKEFIEDILPMIEENGIY